MVDDRADFASELVEGFPEIDLPPVKPVVDKSLDHLAKRLEEKCSDDRRSEQREV